MKKPVLVELSKGTYRFKLKYSTLCDLRNLGVDLLTEGGARVFESDPSKIRTVFWKGLECGEMRKVEEAEAIDLFDLVMEELGPEEFSKMIGEGLAIKNSGVTGKK